MDAPNPSFALDVDVIEPSIFANATEKLSPFVADALKGNDEPKSESVMLLKYAYAVAYTFALNDPGIDDIEPSPIIVLTEKLLMVTEELLVAFAVMDKANSATDTNVFFMPNSFQFE